MERNNIYRKAFLLLSIVLFGINAYSQFAISSLTTDDLSCRVGYGQIAVYTQNRTGDVFFGLYNKPPFPPTPGLETYGEYTVDEDTLAFNEIAGGLYYVVAVDLNTADVQGTWINLATVQTQVLTANTVTVISGPTCFGWNDAVLQANAAGGNPPYTYTWNPGGVSGMQYTTAGAPGIYSVTINDSYNCDTSSYSDNVEGFIYPLSHPSVPAPLSGGTITATDASVCIVDNPGVINNTSSPAGGTGSYTYDWEWSLTGAAPWTSLGENALTYDPPVLGQSTYYRRVTVDASCGTVYSNTVLITVNPLPGVFNVGGGGSYCSGGAGVTITLSGSESGVNYELYLGGAPTGTTLAGDGAPLGFVNITIAGTYTVVATNATTTCQVNMTGSAAVSIDPLPTVYNVGGGGSYCTGGTGVSITLSGSQGGVNYELYLGGAPTGTILPGTGAALSFNNITAAGTYTIVATNAATTCQNNMSGSAAISIDPLPNVYNVGGGGSYCAGGTGVAITLSGSQSGVNYELYLGGIPTGTILPGTGGSLSFNNITTAGNYTILAVSGSTGCQNNMSGSATVSIDPLPTVYNVGGGGSYCAGGAGVTITLSGSQAGVNYELYIGGAPTGTILPGTGGILSFNNITTAGTYTVVATDAATTCQNNMSGSAVVTIDPLPTVYNVGGGGNYCAGGAGVSVTLSGSEAGVNYELYLGGVPTGTILPGTGAALSFNNITTAGTYTVVATNAATTCQNNMSGSAVVSIDPLPTAYNVTGGGSGCFGIGVAVGLDGSQAGVNYELYIGGAPTGTILPGTGSSLSFGNQTTAGTYTVVATNASTTCQNTMTGNAVVSIDPLPTVYNVGGGGSYCAGGTGVSITLSGSQGGVNYELYLGGAPTGTILPGTGAPLSFNNITAAGTYTIVATNPATTCQNNMSGSAAISIDPLPNVYNVGGGGSYCAGGTGVAITLSGSQSGVNYELYLGGIPTGTILPGTGGSLSFNNITTAGTYTIVATNAATTCQNNMSGTAVVSIDPLPAVYNVGGGGSYCAGGAGVSVTLSGSEAGVNYELYLDGVPTGTLLPGTGAGLSFDNITAAGTYTIVAANATTACQNNMSANAVVTIDPLPTGYNVGGGGSYCAGGAGVSITLSGSEAGVNYELYLGGVPTGTILPGTGAALSFDNITAAGTYTVVATNAATTCQNNMSGNAVITINPLPVATASSNSPVCEDESLDLTGGPGSMASYSWIGPDGFSSTLQSPNVSGAATSAMAGLYTLTVVDLNGCINSANTTVVVNDIPIITIAPDPGNTCTNQDLPVFALVAGGTGTYDTYTWTGTGSAHLDVLDNPITNFNSPFAGTFGLTLTVTDDGGCSGIGTSTINVIDEPTSYAGPDTTLCFGSTYHIIDADTTNSDGIQWVSLGDGTFDVNNILDPIYTPGPNDIANGSVRIVLRASGIGSCGNATDTAVINLPPAVQPLIGAPAPFLIGPNTIIEVSMSTTGHQYIEDLGFYLRSPDGQFFTLKRGILETNFFLPPCFNFVGGGDTDSLRFTTELPLSDTLDLCTAPLPVTGSYAATGDWSMLYNMNPAEGGWAIAINDTADFGTSGVDGFISSATITFIDTSTITGTLTPIRFSSGPIAEPIRDDRMNIVLIQRDLQVSCPGECDAIALVTTTGGVPPYATYTWSPIPASGNGTDNVTLCAGTYDLTVYDAIGCWGTTSVTVLEPPVITIDDINYTDTLSCNGTSDGIISVKASGGTGGRQYTLLPDIPSEAADSGYFTGLPVGTYTIRIEDANACYIDTSLTIYEPDALVLESAMVTDSVFCIGDNNGRIVATASGGTEPHTFILEPAGISNNTGEFINLAPGSYLVRLTDANDCDTINSDTLILGVPVPLLIDTVIVDPIVCNGGSGLFTVVVTGGTPPYNILVDGVPEVSGVVDTAYITRGVGNYDISVEDARLCTDSWATVSLTDPPAMVLTNLILTPVTGCYTNPNGEILVNVTGGVPPLEYSLDGNDTTYQSSNVFTGLTGGNYTVYYRDSLGCVGTKDTTMISPPQLLGNPVVVNVEGEDLGSIELFPSGGTPFAPPHEYLISFNGGALDTISLFEDLAIGAYPIHIEDSLGCPWDTIINIVEILLDVTVQGNAAECNDESSGSIYIWMNDGTPPYDIFLDGTLIYDDVPDNFRSVTNVPAGDYLIRVVDSNLVEFDTTVTITEPPEITFQKSVTSTTCSEYNLDGSTPSDGGIIYSNFAGGTGTLSYSWSGSDITDPARDNLTGGSYTFRVTDENGCVVSNETFIGGIDIMNAVIEISPRDPNGTMSNSEIEAYPLPSDDTLCYLSVWNLLARYNENDVENVQWGPDSLLDDPGDADKDIALFTHRQSTYFSLKVWNDRCMDYDSIFLSMYDTIGMLIETDGNRVGDSIYNPLGNEINLTSTDGYAEYLWQAADLFTDIETQTMAFIPEQNQLVRAMGTTFSGCYEADTVYVVIQEPINEIYDVFTPNGDGYNDTWVIPVAHQYLDMEVFIYNRWGQMVFYGRPYGPRGFEFDGNSQKNGKPLPIGSYYYIINPNDGEQETLKGTVTIVR